VLWHIARGWTALLDDITLNVEYVAVEKSAVDDDGTSDVVLVGQL
jgi:hypothetical protein